MTETTGFKAWYRDYVGGEISEIKTAKKQKVVDTIVYYLEMSSERLFRENQKLAQEIYDELLQEAKNG